MIKYKCACLLLLWGSLSSFHTFSQSAIFKIQKKIPAPSFIIGNRVAIAHYQVSNNWSVPLKKNGLTVGSPVKQTIDNEKDSCNQTIDLSAKSHCLLKLEIDGALLKSPLAKGPRLCHTQKNPIYCSDPFTESDQLKTKHVPTPPSNAPTLAINTKKIILQPHVDTLLSITNQSNSIAANNVDIVTKNTPFEGLIESDNSQCLHLLPNRHCVLLLRLKKAVDLAETPLQFQGANTQTGQLAAELKSATQNEAHALITDPQTNDIKSCEIHDSQLSLSHCHTVLHTDYIMSAINFSSNKLHAYLADNSVDSIQCCDLNDETGELSHCMKAASGFKHIDYGFVSFNRYGTQAYIPDGGGNQILYCDVDQAGMLNDCKATGSRFHDPEALIINKKQDQVFVTNFSNNSLTHCNRLSNGTLVDCSEHPGFDGPVDLSINKENTKLYITNFQGHSVSLCNIAKTGMISNCHTTGAEFNQPVAIRLSLLNDYAYIINSGVFGRNSLSQCEVTKEGELVHCQKLLMTSFKSPYGMALY